jgi:hypothetical protein
VEISEANREYSKRMAGLSLKFGKYATTYGSRRVDHGLHPTATTTSTSSAGNYTSTEGTAGASDTSDTGTAPAPDSESILSISAEDPEAAIFAFFHNSRLFNSKLAIGLGDLASTINGPIGSSKFL